MGYSGARGTLIYEKNPKAKISCQTPFKKPKEKFDPWRKKKQKVILQVIFFS